MEPSQKQQQESILRLGYFDRFAYLISALERYSDQDCSVLLACTRRDILTARTRALRQIGSSVESHRKQLPNVGTEKLASNERRSSALDLLVTPHLATSV
jgi:hypothetical protein